jgi:hypothetical protein
VGFYFVLKKEIVQMLKKFRIASLFTILTCFCLWIAGCGNGSKGTATAPTAPTGVVATAGNGEVVISWAPVAGATSYNIYYSTTAGVTKTTGTKVAQAVSPQAVTLTNGAQYYFVVTAVNAIGESVESTLVSATPGADIGADIGGDTLANDVNITVTNETDEFQNIVIFQQEDMLNQMFVKIFPVAWKVFPLNPRRDGQAMKGNTVYPVTQSVGITSPPVISYPYLLPFKTLTITSDANNKDQFKYYLDDNNAQKIDLLPGKNDDESISCRNDTTDLVAIAFCKNSSVLVTQTNVANGDKAVFKLTPKLYFMYQNNIREGEIFRSMQTGENVKEVELTGLSRITARLMYDPNVGGKKKMWVIEKNR